MHGQQLVLAAAVVAMCICASSAQVTCSVTSVVGCYQDFTDQATRILTNGPFSIGSQEDCAAQCNRAGFPLAGVEFGTQCFCGTQFNPSANSTAVPMSQCQVMHCNNNQEWCGDADRILVFNYKCSGTPIPNYQGCIDPAATALPYCNTKLSIEARVADLTSHLSLTEKISLIAPLADLNTCDMHVPGIERIGLPPYSFLVETNSGVASACLSETKCASTPVGSLGLAASFNTTVFQLKGQVIGTEMRAFRNAGGTRNDGDAGDLIGLTGYGPNINIARDPRFGRTSELAGEDPFLAGTYAAYMSRGMATKDSAGYPLMISLYKHYAMYSRETDRGHDTYNASMHDLFETYLKQYEIAFTQGEGVGAMCSYNGINGSPSCANNFILNKVLREMWNITDAHITTDCGAVQNLLGPPINAATPAIAAAMALNNGTDLEMGSTVWTYHLQDAVNQGLTTEAAVDAALRRTFLPHFRAGRFDPLDASEWNSITTDVINSTAHQEILYDAALQSIVLLKNDGVLPLTAGKKVAVVGPMGITRQGLLQGYSGDQICFSNYDCIPTIGEAISLFNVGGVTTNTTGVDVDSSSTSDVAHALALAQAADVVILALGIDQTQEHEGIDRTDTALPGQQEPFALQVLALKKPTVLVLCNGGALAIDNLMEGPNAIIEAFNPAVVGARALAQTIFGKANRWGKLPTTMYPHDYINQQPMTNYDMALPPGRTYKYYNSTPLFAFGHGLSYTTFNMSCVSQNPKYSFSCSVKNVGPMDGDEVIMAYHAVGADVRAQANHPIPIKELVAFNRVTVPVGSTETIKFSFPLSAFQVINADGVNTLYHGTHQMIFSRGVGTDVVFTITL